MDSLLEIEGHNKFLCLKVWSQDQGIDIGGFVVETNMINTTFNWIEKGEQSRGNWSDKTVTRIERRSVGHCSGPKPLVDVSY